MVLTPDTSDCLHLYILSGFRYAHVYFFNQRLMVLAFGTAAFVSEKYPTDQVTNMDMYSFRFQVDMEPVREWNRTIGYVNRMTTYDKPYLRWNVKQQVWNMVVCCYFYI